MKKLLWTSAMALTAAACMTACDDSSSGASNSIPEFKTEAALPDTCEMEVAKAGDTYFACFENKWIEVTDSATVEQLKEGLDEDEVKAKLEELEDLLKPTTPAKPKSSSSKNTDEDVDSSDSDEPESSASEEECTGRRCKTGSSSSKKSSGGSGSGESGSGSGEGGSGEGGESGDSSPSSTDSSGDSSPSSAESSSPSSVSSSSLKRHVNFSPIDDYVTWSEDGTKATLNNDIDLATLQGIFTTTNKYQNLNIADKSALTMATKALEKWGSPLKAELGDFLTSKRMSEELDSNFYILIVNGMEKGDVVYTDIAPTGLCGTSSTYAKRTQFCTSGTIYPLCNGKTYDPTEQFCDTRGTGTLYKYVTIGEQVWMAENLNYETASGSYCYDDEPDNCTEYGRLYDWDVAVNTTSPVCPTGWKVPSASDFNTLLTYIKNDSGSDRTNYMLRSTTGWDKYEGSDENGNNQYGFNLKPAGDRMNGKYENLGKTAYLVVTDGTYTYFLSTQGRSDANMYTWTTTTFARSVRCIKDTAGED